MYFIKHDPSLPYSSSSPGPQSLSMFAEFGSFKFSPSKANGTFSRSNSSGKGASNKAVNQITNYPSFMLSQSRTLYLPGQVQDFPSSNCILLCSMVFPVIIRVDEIKHSDWLKVSHGVCFIER